MSDRDPIVLRLRESQRVRMPSSLRARVLAAASPVAIRPASRLERIWASRPLRWSWAGSVVLLLLVELFASGRGGATTGEYLRARAAERAEWLALALEVDSQDRDWIERRIRMQLSRRVSHRAARGGADQLP